MALHNRLFDDDIHLERVVPSHGRLSIVTSQPFIRGTDAPQEAINAYMAGKGFVRLNTGIYHHGGEGLLAYDLFPKNAKIDDAGFVFLIDPVIQRVTEEFAEFMRFFPVRH